MKVRVVLMTENDKHAEGASKEEIERTAKIAWDFVCKQLEKNGEKAICESTELIER